MNRPFLTGPADTVAARVGRATAAALELACKAAVVVVGMALFLGMVVPRHAPSEGPASPGRPRIAVDDDGHAVRIVPQAIEGQDMPRLILHDPSGRETCTIEYLTSGPLILFGRTGDPVRMGLRAKPGGGICWSTSGRHVLTQLDMGLRPKADGGMSWCMMGRRATTQFDVGPDGATDVTVFSTGPDESLLGRVRVPAEEKPAGNSGGR